MKGHHCWISSFSDRNRVNAYGNLHPNETKMQNSCALDGQLYTRQPLLLAISEILKNPHKVKNHYMWIFQNVWKKPAFTCSKLTIVTLEQGAKYVQS